MIRELWRTIPEFPNYEISNLGRVYNNRQHIIMRTSQNNYGHTKITLKSDRSRFRYTRSVAQLVAEAFVEPPNALCDQVVVLDGDFSNVAAYNLVWRPRWFAWKYTHQLKIPQPIHFQNLRVADLDGKEYSSVVEAGMSEGLLFDDIWRSTYMGNPVFPHGSVWEIVQRV